MPATISLQLIFFFWQIGLVDTFSLIQFCVNSCSQYGAIVAGAAAGNFSNIGPKVFMEPLLGLGTSYQFVRRASSAIERRKRIATLASFLATSASAITMDPATNAAVGGAVSAKIAYMRAIIDTRGGGQQLLEYILTPSLEKYLMKDSSIRLNSVMTPLLNSAQSKVQQTGNIIVKNIFAEHTQQRVNQGLAKKVLCSISVERAVHTLPKIGVLGLIGYFSLGLGIGALGIYFGSNLLREAKDKHAKMMVESNSNQVVIDVEVMDV